MYSITNLTNDQRLAAMHRMIEVSLGYEDQTVTNVGIGTTRSADQLFAIGNWNGELGERLCNAFERLGAECFWYDEAYVCGVCSSAIPTQPSHSQPEYITLEGDVVCLACFTDKSNGYTVDDLDSCINEPNRVLIFAGAGDWLIEEGFIAEETLYENGFYPGMAADPANILKELQENHNGPGELQVIMVVEKISQFHITFRAYTRVI